MFYKNLVFSTVIVLTACSSYQPNYINGKYYMAGDSSCARYSQTNPNQINCYTKSGDFTGIRNTMTVEDMQMYQAVREQKRRDFDEINDTLRQNNYNYNYTAPSYSSPNPLIYQNQKNRINCNSTSSGYTYCR